MTHDAIYFMNISNYNGKTRQETTTIRKEVWYYRTADLENLNHETGTSSSAVRYSVPKELSEAPWGGRMWDIPLGTSGVLIRAGFMDKSDTIDAALCCKNVSANVHDPLPVGYAGRYCKPDAKFGVLLPIFKPFINRPLVAHTSPGPNGGPYELARVAYYMSAAPRPKVEKAMSEKTLEKLRASLASDVEVPISDDSAQETDENGDFKNSERIDSHEHMLDNFAENDGDAGWHGQMLDEGNTGGALDNTNFTGDEDADVSKGDDGTNGAPET